MAKENELRFWRGLESARSGITPLQGEPIYTTDKKQVWIGDGSRAGGTLVGPDGNFALGHRSGTRYSSAVMFTGPTGAAMFSNVLAFVPFCCGKRTTFSEIGLQVTAAGTGSVRLGIYENGDGEPSDLVLDAGTVAVTSTGVKTISISQTLEAGWYWLASVFQAGGSPAAIASVATVSHPSLGFATTPGVQQGMFQVYAYAALPASATSPTLTGAALPILFLGV
jgi:hypothetical protein